MKSRKSFFLLWLFIFPNLFSTIILVTSFSKPFHTSSLPFFSAGGVSNYNVTQSVKYQVDINFTLTHNSLSSGDYWFKFSRLNDRQPNNTLTQYCPPYQESKILFSQITAPSYVLKDKFNNTYDLFNTTLNYHNSISVDQKYNITLNEVSFKNINMSEIGIYNMSDEVFDLYCNNSETYYERDNPTLIAVSNSIVNPSDNPVEKAEKVCDWVANYLTYDNFMPAQEQGALWAYNNQRGDCSEYSSLMITLLRIQNIPARKVTGFCISANPKTKPYVGQEWTFNSYLTGGYLYSNFLGHAWVEYYVENIGWIACDPTWHSSGFDYFNRIDYLRFNLNIGQWFSIPLLSDQSEFPHPCIVYELASDFDYDYQFKVKALEVTLAPGDGTLSNDFLILLLVITLSAILVITLVAILIITKKRRKKEVIFHEY